MTACTDAANGSAAGGAAPVELTCAMRLSRLVAGYDAIVGAMMAGQVTTLVQFGEQKIMYEASTTTMNLVLSQIAQMNKACPSPAASAILGLGGNQGPLRPHYNPPTQGMHGRRGRFS